jgi:hypothetical protein
VGGRSTSQLEVGKRIIGKGIGIRVLTRKEEEGGEMGKLFLVELQGNIYSCKHCVTHFALADDIMSKVSPCFFLFNQHPLLENKKRKKNVGNCLNNHLKNVVLLLWNMC